jgi:hypothetical protein
MENTSANECEILAIIGKVEQRHGLLLHFCAECGAWGSFGVGVSLRVGRLDRWYCAEHRQDHP